MTSKEAVRTLRLEVERANDPGELVNLVQNPDGRLGAWGYVTPVDGSVLRGGGPSGTGLTYTSPGTVNSYFSTEPMPVSAGSWAAALIRVDAGSGAYRLSIDWLNGAGAVIGSTTPSAYFTPAGDLRVYGSYQAPSGAVHAQLRVNHYATTSGGNPAAGAALRFKDVTFAIAGSSGALGSVRTNLFPNSSGEGGTAGWWIRGGGDLSTVAGGVAGGQAIRATKTDAGRGLVVDTSYAGILGGRDYAFQIRSRYASGGPRSLVLYAAWFNAAGTEIGLTQIDTATQPGIGWSPVLGGTATAPSAAVGARLRTKVVGAVQGESHDFDASMAEAGRTVTPYFDGSTPDAAGVDYAWVGAAHGSASTATSSQAGVVAPVQWLNILGPTHEISVSREALNIGLLSATVLDAALDPSQTDTIRPGRRVRLMAVDGDGVDQVLYTGWVGADLKVEYRLLENDPVRRARISLTGVDAVNRLASSPRAEGVATIAELPYVLEGAGVPWSVNGSGDQVPTATVVATNTAATAADQLAVTRDTVHGYAWVDREGVVQAWDRNLMPSTPVLTLDEDVYNADFEVGYDTESIINSIGVTVLKVIATSGVTEEVTYGPFTIPDSVTEWGLHHQDYTVSIPADDGAAWGWAASVLLTNAWPEVLVRQCVVPITEVDHLDRALLDLYDPVTVRNDRAGVDQVQRVTRLEHAITATPEGGKWLMTVGFNGEGVAAASTSVPSPPPRVGDIKDEIETELEEIYELANEAAAAAADAAANATAAMDAANGKNKVTYSLSTPGSSPNTAGDIWFRKDSETQTIIGQWEGLGGTSWGERQLRNEVIANLDAGKLTAGSAFTNALSVKTNFTLGDATTDGVIQSYNFANSSTGVFINKNGVVAKGGSIAGATISGGTVTVTSNGGHRGVLTNWSGVGAGLMFYNSSNTFLGGLYVNDSVGRLGFWSAGSVNIGFQSGEAVVGGGGIRITEGGISSTGGVGTLGDVVALGNVGASRLKMGTDAIGGGSPVVVDTQGMLFKQSSSLKYKKYVHDLTEDVDLDAAWQLRPVTFEPKVHADGQRLGPRRRYAGFIAEEVHELGLTEVVVYDDAEEPDGLHYGQMTALAVALAQDERAKRLALEDRVTALEQLIQNLTSSTDEGA